jgi:tetratricopeptide (TPR) repeat protein
MLVSWLEIEQGRRILSVSYGMFRLSSSKYAIIAALAAGICGLFHSLPLLGAPPTQASLAAAIRGIASLQQFDGFGTASWVDQIAAHLWRSGGASLLATGQWMAVFAGWTVAAVIAFTVVFALIRLLNDPRARGILFRSAVVLALASGVPPLWETIAQREDRISDLRLVLPAELADKVRALDQAKTFANPSALAHLLLFAPNLAGSVSMADSVRLSTNPAQWREGLRRAKWNAVLLSGTLGEYRPLLDHLMGSPDWHLASITNHGFLFLYGSGLPARSLDGTFQCATDLDTAVYLAQISGYYDAIRRASDARACIERALELAPNSITVLSHAATFAAAHKRWQDAIGYSRRALARDHRPVHAKLVQALALLETREAGKARELVDEVLVQSPDDPYALFLSARIRRSLNDYAREAESLEKLVAIGQRAGISTANYRIYLGQAYARQSLAEPALQNYRAALDSGQLDAKQAEEVQDAINSIESKRTP